MSRNRLRVFPYAPFPIPYCPAVVHKMGHNSYIPISFQRRVHIDPPTCLSKKYPVARVRQIGILVVTKERQKAQAFWRPKGRLGERSVLTTER
jgi:hypothetical protein